MLRARSVLEARLYIELEPCARCGARGFAEPTRIVERGDALGVACSGYCSTCGENRAFELALADERVPPMAWGNRDASTLIDAGNWYAFAEELGARVPGTTAGLDAATIDNARANLARAIAAVEEVLKFLPDGVNEVPRGAFFTARGRDYFAADPARFGRIRLEALRDGWCVLADDLDGELADLS